MGMAWGCGARSKACCEMLIEAAAGCSWKDGGWNCCWNWFEGWLGWKTEE